MTGTIHVEEVVILNKESSEETKPRHYRRLVFRRNPNLIQSEASLITVKSCSKERGRTKNGIDVMRRHSGNKKKHKAKDATVGFRTGPDSASFVILYAKFSKSLIHSISVRELHWFPVRANVGLSNL